MRPASLTAVVTQGTELRPTGHAAHAEVSWRLEASCLPGSEGAATVNEQKLHQLEQQLRLQWAPAPAPAGSTISSWFGLGARPEAQPAPVALAGGPPPPRAYWEWCGGAAPCPPVQRYGGREVGTGDQEQFLLFDTRGAVPSPSPSHRHISVHASPQTCEWAHVQCTGARA